jgi:hypothetical protein
MQLKFSNSDIDLGKRRGPTIRFGELTCGSQHNRGYEKPFFTATATT